jgi:hypothetical protein
MGAEIIAFGPDPDLIGPSIPRISPYTAEAADRGLTSASKTPGRMAPPARIWRSISSEESETRPVKRPLEASIKT